VTENSVQGDEGSSAKNAGGGGKRLKREGKERRAKGSQSQNFTGLEEGKNLENPFSFKEKRIRRQKRSNEGKEEQNESKGRGLCQVGAVERNDPVAESYSCEKSVRGKNPRISKKKVEETKEGENLNNLRRKATGENHRRTAKLNENRGIQGMKVSVLQAMYQKGGVDIGH